MAFERDTIPSPTRSCYFSISTARSSISSFAETPAASPDYHPPLNHSPSAGSMHPLIAITSISTPVISPTSLFATQSPTTPRSEAASRFFQLQTQASHQPKLNRPNLLPLQLSTPPRSISDFTRPSLSAVLASVPLLIIPTKPSADDDDDDNDSSIDSTKSDIGPLGNNLPESLRCSRCHRTSIKSINSPTSGMMQYGLNLYYCHRCAGIVGLRRKESLP